MFLVARSRNDILWRFLADTKSLDKGTRKAEANLSTTQKATNRATAAWGGMTKAVGALGLAIGGRELAQWAGEAIKVAESAGIVAESFNTTFGPASDDLRDSLEETRRVMGLSSAAAETALLPMGQLAQAMGLGTEEAATFSEQLFIVAGDLAAFDGDLSDSEAALGALQSALKGEFDPLEQFGVKLKQADINAKALEITGKELTEELTNQDLALASLQLILEQVGDETGSLMAMQDSAQGQANRLTAEYEDLRIELGTALIPAQQGATQAALEWIEASKSNVEQNGKLVGSLKTATEWLYEMWTRVNLLGMAFRWLKGRIEAIGNPIERLIQWIQDIPSSIPNPFSGWKMPNISIPNPLRLIGRASGGSVSAGTPYMVGERGPELMVPGQSGTIVPNRNVGAGPTINVNFNGVVGDPVEVAAQIQDLIELYGQSNGLR